jgi:hypothetical protein
MLVYVNVYAEKAVYLYPLFTGVIQDSNKDQERL